MAVYALGSRAILRAQFQATPGGAGADPPLVTLTVTRDGETVLAAVTHPGTIIRIAPGSYEYGWEIPPTLQVGTYIATWSGEIAEVPQVGTEELVLIASGLISTGPDRIAWATTSDVYKLTSEAVTQLQLDQANATIELVSGRVWLVAASSTSTRDTEWMRRAVAYQAAWLKFQPDAFQRMDLLNLSAGGRGATLTPSGVVLAPMARWALRRVSWMRSRSVIIRSHFTHGHLVAPSPVAEANDACEDWMPMPSALDSGRW